MKIKTRIILLFTTISTFYIVSFAIYVSYFTRDSLQTKFYHRLEENATIVGNHIVQNDEYNNQIYYEVRRKYLAQLSEGKDYLLRIVKDSTNLRFKPDLPMPASFYTDAIVNGRARYLDGKTSYVAAFFVDTMHNEDLLVISEGVDEYGHDEQRTLDRTVLSGALIAVGLVFLISFYFANNLLVPIQAINNDLTQIDISHLDMRLQNKFNSENDEIGTLIANFNSMMNRLDISVRSQQSFIGNASHSLRTPLTILAGEAELALQSLDKQDEAYYSVEEISRQVGKMELIVNNLLLLSRSGFDRKIENKQLVRIDELLYEVQRNEKAVRPESRIRLDFSNIPEESHLLNIFVNPDLFYIAFSNILSNACKYGEDNVVTISLECHLRNITIKIADDGFGIPAQDMPHVFDSFFRASNVGQVYGNGLGLALAKNIFDLHSARLTIHSVEKQGTDVIVEIPV